MLDAMTMIVPWVFFKRLFKRSKSHLYGMIANVDENLGKLRARLRKLALEQDTILLFMNDNGTAGGATLAGAANGNLFAEVAVGEIGKPSTTSSG